MIWKVLLVFCVPVIQGKLNASKRKLKVDREHLKFDFADIFAPLAAIFTDSEMDFRYFAAHDYDKNNKLDGLELFTALGHDSMHDHEKNEKEELQSNDIERQVDDIFEDHDGNNDGFLDYKEFMTVQRFYPDISGGKKQHGNEL